MSVSSSTAKTGPLACNGSLTAFPSGAFRILADDEITVTLTNTLVEESELTLATDYTISPTGGTYPADSFTVNTVATYDTGFLITISRNNSFTQGTSYGKQGPFDPQIHETDFDRTVLRDQELREELDRCVKQSISDDDALDAAEYLAACEADAARAEAAVGGYPTAEVYLSSYGSLSTAVSTIGSAEVTLVIDQDDTLVADLVIPPNISLRQVGDNAIDGAYDLTINGRIYVGLSQVFGPLVTVLRLDNAKQILPQWWGAKADASNDDTAAIQSAVNAGIASKTPVYLTSSSGTTEFKITSTIVCSSEVTIIGAGENKTTLLCVGCSGIQFSAPATRCTLRGFGIAQAIRHTTTPNTYTAIAFLGSTGSRPYWNVVQNIFIDGFQRAIYGNWMWETTITQCKILFSGTGIDLDGVCANNYFHTNSISVNTLALNFGDSTNTIEGIHVHSNLIDCMSLGNVLDWKGAAYCKFNDNVCDFVGAGTGLLIRSAGTLPTVGNSVRGNYIAFGANASEGIRLLNSLASSPGHGNVLFSNVIFPYSGSTLSTGLLIDGSQEENTIVSCNNITAGVYDVNNAGLNSIFTSNLFQGNGFYSTTECIYTDNKGSVLASADLLTRVFGKITEYFGSAMPTSGSYVSGDIVRYTGLSINVNNMVLTGWIRLTTGSGNVLGTDWAAQYVSHVTPAT